MKRTVRSFWIGLSISTCFFLALIGGTFAFLITTYLPNRDMELEAIWLENQASNSAVAYRLKLPLLRGETITKEHLEVVDIPGNMTGDFLFDNDSLDAQLSASRDLSAGMVLYKDMIYDPQEIPPDLRVVEISELVMPLTLKKGDCIDVRISFPSGLDYVVLSKKEVKGLVRDADGSMGGIAETNANTSTSEPLIQPKMILLNLNASEILTYSSAIVDAFFKPGTYLYVSPYVSADYQKEAVVNYPCNEVVQKLMMADPNIVNRAKLALSLEQRAFLNNSLSKVSVETVRPQPKTLQGVSATEEVQPQPSLSDLDN